MPLGVVLYAACTLCYCCNRTKPLHGYAHCSDETFEIVLSVLNIVLKFECLHLVHIRRLYNVCALNYSDEYIRSLRIPKQAKTQRQVLRVLEANSAVQFFAYTLHTKIRTTAFFCNNFFDPESLLI